MTAKKPPSEWKKSGRPSKMTAAAVEKMTEGFCSGLTVTECALYVGVDRTTLWAYLKAHPDVAQRIEDLQRHPVMQAKRNISGEIDRGNIPVSQWYLERKARDEFGNRADIGLTVDAAALADKETAIADYMRGFLGVATE